MKLHYTFLLALCLIFSSSVTSYSQDFQGKAIYQTKTTVDMSNFGGRQMSEQQKKMIADRMKSMLEKTYELNFNRAESIYKEEVKLDAPGQGGSRWGAMMGSFSGGPQYKNVKENLLLQEQEFFGKQFLIKDSLPKLEWKMENETKQIGEYLCFKATAVKEVEDEIGNWRRRGNETASTDSTGVDSEDVPKTTLITAWYTPQIPVNQGPADYWGLPGLILEVNAGRTTMLCTKLILNPEDKAEIKEPKKGEEVTREEYSQIVKDKMEEMREMYGRRGRDRG